MSIDSSIFEVCPSRPEGESRLAMIMMVRCVVRSAFSIPMFGRCGCTPYVLNAPMMDVEPIPRLQIGIKRIPDDLNISNYIEPRFVSHVALVHRRSRMARVSEQSRNVQRSTRKSRAL